FPPASGRVGGVLRLSLIWMPGACGSLPVVRTMNIIETNLIVIASEARQSRRACFVATLLAMTALAETGRPRRRTRAAAPVRDGGRPRRSPRTARRGSAHYNHGRNPA